MARLPYRDHSALELAAGPARVLAVFSLVVTVVVALGMSSLRSAAFAGVPLASVGFGAVVVVVLAGLTYAVMLWAVADVFIMLADSDDGHRQTHYEIVRVGLLVEALSARFSGAVAHGDEAHRRTETE